MEAVFFFGRRDSIRPEKLGGRTAPTCSRGYPGPHARNPTPQNMPKYRINKRGRSARGAERGSTTTTDVYWYTNHAEPLHPICFSSSLALTRNHSLLTVYALKLTPFHFPTPAPRCCPVPSHALSAALALAALVLPIT